MTATAKAKQALIVAMVIAEEDGYRAYIEDRPIAPACSPTVMTLISGLRVGEGAAEIFKAFGAGWRRAADEECARILAD